MKKTLFNTLTSDNIIKRVEKLSVNNKPMWGEMNATEMLLHCNSCNRQILEEGRRPGSQTSLGQYILRILALYLAPNFKKGIQSEDRHIAIGKISSAEFEAQKESFIQLIRQFPANSKELTLTHPAFGNISTKEWGIAAYKHMDHHLRQFGV